MPRTKAKDELSKPTGTVIGQGFTIQAVKLAGTDPIRVDGVILGNVDLNGPLHLSETGVVEGDVLASSARIAGQVIGNIDCQTLLHVAATAVVTGDIAAETIIVDQGAVLHGMFKTRPTPRSENILTYNME
jgi:cytoskeletal protein CcmA (bactofilin family)